jgi:hypothetical protein
MEVVGLKNHNFLPWGCSSNLIGSAKGFWGCWETFIKYFFSINQLLYAFFGLRGVFLASNSLHEVRGQKWSCPCYNPKNFEQIYCSKLFCRMYGLAVMLSISRFDYHVSYSEHWPVQNKSTSIQYSVCF